DQQVADPYVEVIVDGVRQPWMADAVDALHPVETEELGAESIVEETPAEGQREAGLEVAHQQIHVVPEDCRLVRLQEDKRLADERVAARAPRDRVTTRVDGAQNDGHLDLASGEERQLGE